MPNSHISEVRRAALLNIPLSSTALPAILSRTRDVDTTLRRLVYSAILEPNILQNDTPKTIGVTHPRALSISQREMIVRNGLGDREAGVKSAAAAVIGAWIDIVPEDQTDGKEGDVVAFLKLFDLTQSRIAEDALLSLFTTRVDIFDNLEFGGVILSTSFIFPDGLHLRCFIESFWAELTPERAFLARVFVQHSVDISSARLESALPVVTALAFRIQSNYNDLLQLIQAEEEYRTLGGDEDEAAKREEERCDKEFVVGEMCVLAVRLDYSDEIGRRKMFQLVRKFFFKKCRVTAYIVNV
jgi:condensin complex subunit 3